MEAGTAAKQSTGSKTIADLIGRAAEQFGDRVAVRHKVDGEWRDVTYAQVGEIVREIGLGLVDLGIQPGERVCILADTRPEWTYADFAISAAGGVVVPIYPTNSPEECEWVAGNSEAVGVICEDAKQLAKLEAVRERLPALRFVVVVEPGDAGGDAIALDELRARGRTRDAGELEARAAAVAPEDPFTFIYTSGTTGPPKGCVLTHAQLPRRCSTCASSSTSSRGEETSYLFLPLAHAFALLVQLLSLRPRRRRSRTSAATRSRSSPSSTRSIRPTCRRVPRIFEKIYTLALGSQPADVQERMRAAARLGVKVRDMQARGEEVARRAARALRAGRRGALQARARDLRRAARARPSPAPRRSPRRSSSSSTAAACRCSRATA